MNSIDSFRLNVMEIARGARQLEEDISRLIQVESVEDWEFSTRRGRLHAGSLYRVPSGASDVFRRVNQPIVTGDTAIEFLGDASGSMSGPRFYALTASFMMLLSACQKVGASCEFTMFTEDWTTRPQYYVLKDWDATCTQEQMLTRCHWVEQRLGNNPDGEALLWATNRLLSRKESNKVLIVLSDGQPCTRAMGDAATHLRKVVQSIESEGIDVFGIGLMSDTVKLFYSQYEIVRDPAALPSMFLNILKSRLIGVNP